MQNSQPSPGFPRKAQHQDARIAPRRTRRGALMPAAVLAVLVITIVMSQFAQAQLRHASAARAEARAVQLAAIAADFDYYVHANRVGLATGLTEAGRQLSSGEKEAFEDDLRADVARQMPGFTLTYLVGHIESTLEGGTDIYGGLLLKTDGASEVAMDTLLARLATYGAQDRILNLESFVQNVLGRALDDESQRVILTAPLSGIDPKYVLREDRAGHPPPKLAGGGALDLGGCGRDEEPRKCDLLNVKTLTAIGGAESAAARVARAQPNEQSDPALDKIAPTLLHVRKMTGTLTSLRRDPKEQERIDRGGDDAPLPPYKTGNVDIAGTTSAGKFIVGSTLIAGGAGIFADSTTGEAGSDTAPPTTIVVKGRMTLSEHLQTHTLGAASLRAASIATQHLTLTRQITAKTMVADTFKTPVLKNIQIAADGVPKLTARQVFATASVKVDRLQTEACTGC